MKSLESTPLPKLSMNSPEEILAAIPYLVGFHVRESIVVLVLTGSRVVLTARLDAVLDDETDARFSEGVKECAADRIRVAIEVNQGDGLVVVGYHHHIEPMREFLATLACEAVERLTEGGQGLIDVLLVDGQRWYELLSPEPDAHRGFPLDHDCVPTAAQAVYFGLNALPDRLALEQHVALPTREATDLLGPLYEATVGSIATLRAEERITLMTDLLDAAITEGPGEQACVQLAVLLADVEVRDAVLLTTDVTNAALRTDVWIPVVGRSIAGYELAPLGVLAMSAWLSGNGALQVICIHRLRGLDPGYRLLGILEQINEAALPPSVWGRAPAPHDERV